VKIEKLEELFKQNLAATEIAKILKISDRSVRRWRIRLDNRDNNPKTRASDRSTKGRKSLRENNDDDIEAEQPKPKRRIFKFDKETVDRTKKMLDNGDTNKEIGEALGVDMRTVRKLVKEIFNGTEDNLIDDTLEILIQRKKGAELKKEKGGTTKKIKEERRWSDDDDNDDHFNDDFGDNDDDNDDFDFGDRKEPTEDHVEASKCTAFVFTFHMLVILTTLLKISIFQPTIKTLVVSIS
jgi:hypothetical protein